ncbi:MAG TPA: LysM peptidoglycan-binding domain-containing protein [Egibacteraceae bacterium]|nr:LysM peptidoglycan-binding domain-containing protein [Egibacteraceae bacterium]
MIGGLLVAVAALLILPGLRGAAAAAGPASAAEPMIIVVAEGDTVWDLAREHVPAGQDPAVYSALIVEHNGVDAAALRPGDVLALPAP